MIFPVSEHKNKQLQEAMERLAIKQIEEGLSRIKQAAQKVEVL